jgi:hypothetical protein
LRSSISGEHLALLESLSLLVFVKSTTTLVRLFTDAASMLTGGLVFQDKAKSRQASVRELGWMDRLRKAIKLMASIRLTWSETPTRMPRTSNDRTIIMDSGRKRLNWYWEL